LTVMIEDPRDVERRRLLGIEDPDTPTRDDLATVLEEVSPSFSLLSSQWDTRKLIGRILAIWPVC
jgi:hypothetical protein